MSDANTNKPISFGEIALALANDYDSIYIIDSVDDSYVEYYAEGDNKELVRRTSGVNFYEDVKRNCPEQVHPEDQEFFLASFKKENVTEILETGKSFSLNYRLVVDGKPLYYFLKTIGGNDNKVIIGVQNVDEQRRKELEAQRQMDTYQHISGALSSRYEVIYRVDMITNEYIEYSSSDKYTKLGVGKRGADFFADSQRNMKRDIYEEDYPMMAEAIDRDNILRQLEETNKIFLNYRLNLDGRPQYVSLVIMRVDDDPDHIIVAIENIDEAKRREQEYEAKIGSAIDMANRDALTGIKNKHAYVSAEMQLDGQIREDEGVEFAIVVCDINGLKQRNDEYGHSAGDEFIKDACKIICDTFEHSPVFRVGGDEFVVILRGADYENRSDLLKRFYNIQLDNKRDGLVTISYGISDYDPGKDLRVQDVFERADNLMYENKSRFKSLPVDMDARSMESYSSVRFYELYEQLLSAMNDFDHMDVPLIESLLCKICLMFRLSKAVTRVFRNPQEEREGKGETLCAFDLGIEGVEIMNIRVVTSVMSIANMKVYMSPDEEPLSNEEYEKVNLVARTVLSFISSNRLRDIVYELAYFDESGYPNLRSLNRDIASLLKNDGFRNKMAVRYNLRHFSIINQEYGRETGDRIIRTHYDTLLKIMGEGAVLVRLGGDNFVGICSKDRVEEVAEYLFEAVIKVDEDHSVKVPSSAGILIDHKGLQVENHGDILGRIINAFRAAQAGDKDRIVYYDETIMERKQKIARVQQKFSDAIAREEFVPYYQPKVDVRTGAVVGGEALCRWMHKGRMIPPAEFIPALEQTSDICKLDLYMLERVCRDQRKWLDGGEGRTLVPMSINFSRKHVMNMTLADTVEKILDKYRIPHDAIEIELTETTTDVEFTDLKRTVVMLKEKGFMASVDDFGAGLSSLHLLKEIPWHTVKIDMSILPEEGDSEDSEKYIMFKYVVGLTKSLGFRCVAEGVETSYQIGVMRDIGCNIAQGFFYDKPLPKEEFEARLGIGRYQTEGD